MEKYTISNQDQKLRDIINEYLEIAVGVCEFARSDTMKELLEIGTADDMEYLGLGDTMREFLSADNYYED